MRKVLSSTAGATFHNETPYMTFNVRKDYIEMIFKNAPGQYIIINMAHIADGTIVLFTNWGNYFNRFQNPQIQMPRIEKNCPTLYNVMVGEDKDNVFEMDLGHGSDKCHGLGIQVEVPKNTPIMKCFSDRLLEHGRILRNKVSTIIHELYHNPPFPAWKDGLGELWN